MAVCETEDGWADSVAVSAIICLCGRLLTSGNELRRVERYGIATRVQSDAANSNYFHSNGNTSDNAQMNINKSLEVLHLHVYGGWTSARCQSLR